MTTFKLNGKQVSSTVADDTPLLYALRGDFEQNGPKFGCGVAQCGSCSVLVEGKVVRSCVMPVSAIKNKEVTTLDGLAVSDSQLHALQQAFLDEQAAQCGYCTNGMIIQASSLLKDNPKANDDEIRQAMSGVLCRCGSQARVLKAIKRAQGADLGTNVGAADL
ncbi:(2Fe-2S)-binding protein [Aliamphritea spongicola]|uniref:(2Fe-2S)-binding protein n=1 Tax=Aliamphritea spongicola TaxID=707589 RepID=UPI00196A41B0|nr:(2Fe-2S)-binding protein [Aliamphritea spongicola]MBN3562835.1 (2Fe-2S)-binding protein [Aliamphritea spongicola]